MNCKEAPLETCQAFSKPFKAGFFKTKFFQTFQAFSEHCILIFQAFVSPKIVVFPEILTRLIPAK